MRVAFVVCACAAVSACGLERLDTTASPIDRAIAPVYGVSAIGTIDSLACSDEPKGGFGASPPGCATQRVFGAQVADPADLLQPRKTGPALAAPAARAAEAYVLGDAPVSAGVGLDGGAGGDLGVGGAASVPVGN